MRKTSKQITKMLLQFTPNYTRPVVELNIKNSHLENLQDTKKIQPLYYYLHCLDKHREYLDFFQIGIVRDQRKKIENVAKYVGLAIRDYTLDMQKNNPPKQLKKDHKQQQQKQDISKHSEIIQNWIGNDQSKKTETQVSGKKQEKKIQN